MNDLPLFKWVSADTHTKEKQIKVLAKKLLEPRVKIPPVALYFTLSSYEPVLQWVAYPLFSLTLSLLRQEYKLQDNYSIVKSKKKTTYFCGFTEVI